VLRALRIVHGAQRLPHEERSVRSTLRAPGALAQERDPG
jgi:hypothetical protein